MGDVAMVSLFGLHLFVWMVRCWILRLGQTFHMLHDCWVFRLLSKLSFLCVVVLFFVRVL